jgi:hypothetical protein
MNNIIQTKQEHLKRNHEETVYLGVYNTISVEVHGLSKDITYSLVCYKILHNNLKQVINVFIKKAT